jgi:hypothetical protein
MGRRLPPKALAAAVAAAALLLAGAALDRARGARPEPPVAAARRAHLRLVAGAPPPWREALGTASCAAGDAAGEGDARLNVTVWDLLPPEEQAKLRALDALDPPRLHYAHLLVFDARPGGGPVENAVFVTEQPSWRHTLLQDRRDAERGGWRNPPPREPAPAGDGCDIVGPAPAFHAEAAAAAARHARGTARALCPDCVAVVSFDNASRAPLVRGAPCEYAGAAAPAAALRVAVAVDRQRAYAALRLRRASVAQAQRFVARLPATLLLVRSAAPSLAHVSLRFAERPRAGGGADALDAAPRGAPSGLAAAAQAALLRGAGREAEAPGSVRAAYGRHCFAVPAALALRHFGTWPAQ